MKTWKTFAVVLGAVFVVCVLVSPNALAQKQLRVLSLNVWHGGRHISGGNDRIADVVETLSPDIVAFSETRMKKGEKKSWADIMAEKLAAKKLRYYHSFIEGMDVCVFSKFKILSSQKVFSYNNSALKCEIDVKGTTLAVVAAHLDFQGYASNLPRGYNSGSKAYVGWKMIDNGKGKPKPITDTKIVLENNAESVRGKQIADILKSLREKTVPTIILGDFNEPSCLDWTKKTKNMFAHNGAVVQWPSTKTLIDNGFKDAFREIYPDEVKNPGITWPSSFANTKKKTSWCPESDDRDRVDYIFYRGKGMKVLDAALVGPKGSYANGKFTTENTAHEKFLASDIKWPSDHKGIFAILQIP